MKPPSPSPRRFLGHATALPLLGASPFASAAPKTTPSLRARLGVTTEEIAEDLETALRFVTSFGLGWVEIRKLSGTYATELPLPTIKEARGLLDKYKIRLSVFDTALFKCDLPGQKSGRKD